MSALSVVRAHMRRGLQRTIAASPVRLVQRVQRRGIYEEERTRGAFDHAGYNAIEPQNFKRHYKFSDHVMEQSPQNGVLAGWYVVFLHVVVIGFAFIYEYFTCPHYRITRRHHRWWYSRTANEKQAILDVQLFGGIFHTRMPDDAPEDFKACFDAKTKKEWNQLTLFELKRRLREKGKNYENVNVWPLTQPDYVAPWAGGRFDTYTMPWDREDKPAAQ